MIYLLDELIMRGTWFREKCNHHIMDVTLVSIIKSIWRPITKSYAAIIFVGFQLMVQIYLKKHFLLVKLRVAIVMVIPRHYTLDVFRYSINKWSRLKHSWRKGVKKEFEDWHVEKKAHRIATTKEFNLHFLFIEKREPIGVFGKIKKQNFQLSSKTPLCYFLSVTRLLHFPTSSFFVSFFWHSARQ